MMSGKIATAASLLAAAMWLGGLVVLGALVAPIVFHEVTAPMSAAAMTHVFLRFDRVSLVALIVVGFAEAVSARVAAPRTWPDRVTPARMRANAIEAAEQCGVLRIPEVDQPVTLERALASWDAQRVLVFCDEEAPISDPVAALSVLKRGAPVAILIGPEGGFSEEERQLVRSRPFVLCVSLGPRIMRADTAAVAALALVSAVAGDWF